MNAIIDLQLFADSGTVVNATTGYVNAYTGANTTFDAQNSLNPTIKEFYDTELLENARVESYYAQFAKKVPLPANNGRRVEFRKWNTFPAAKKLQEGVIPQGEKFGMTSLYGEIYQFGLYTAITDVLQLHGYDPVVTGATQEMGASLAESQERLIRDALFSGTNVVYCPNINYTVAEGKPVYSTTESTPTSIAEMKATSGICSVLTPAVVNKVVTQLKKDRAPRIKGDFVAVIHPSVAEDLRNCSGWVEAHKYAAPEGIFNGEIGRLHGCRFIENPFAPVIKGGNLAGSTRNLAVNGAITGETATITFDGGTVAASALVDQFINVSGQRRKVVANTATTITVDEAVSNIADNAVIAPDGNASGGAVYATYFFGLEAFGIIDPDGGGAEMIVKSKKEVGGPLEQFSTVGYKFETNGATVLYQERMVRVMSCATNYSDIDEAN